VAGTAHSVDAHYPVTCRPDDKPDASQWMSPPPHRRPPPSHASTARPPRTATTPAAVIRLHAPTRSTANRLRGPASRTNSGLSPHSAATSVSMSDDRCLMLLSYSQVTVV